jgi:hypothetical protein
VSDWIALTMHIFSVLIYIPSYCIIHFMCLFNHNLCHIVISMHIINTYYICDLYSTIVHYPSMSLFNPNLCQIVISMHILGFHPCTFTSYALYSLPSSIHHHLCIFYPSSLAKFLFWSIVIAFKNANALLSGTVHHSKVLLYYHLYICDH